MEGLGVDGGCVGGMVESAVKDVALFPLQVCDAAGLPAQHLRREPTMYSTF